MSCYTRPRLPGATVFFTVCLAARGSDLLVRHVDILRDVARRTRRDKPFRIDAWVVLPDHMHCIWTLPEGDADYSNRMGMLKARFSREMGLMERRQSQVARREHGIWHRRFWEHHIRDEADLTAHLRYCWANPVKHGLVARPEDWPFTSYRKERHGDLL